MNQMANIEDETNSIVRMIERAASDPKVDIEKMERLLAMQERVLSRNAEQAFAADMAEMQSELPTISENGEIKVNGQVRSKFAKFEDINEACRPVLKKYGFAVMFKTSEQDAKLIVTCILTHKFGHKEENSIVLPVDNSGSKNNVQGIGSSTSYGKRYALSALLNITTKGEDDDANATGALISEEQYAELVMLLEKTGSDKSKFLKFMGVESLKALPAKSYQKAIKAFKVKAAKK